MPELSYCRRRLLEILGAAERTSADLAVLTGRLQTNITRDLKVMHRAGLVASRRAGVAVLYRATRRGAR